MVKIALYIQCEILKMKPSWQMGRIGGGGEYWVCEGFIIFQRAFFMLCADIGIFLNIYDTARMNFLTIRVIYNIS